MSARNHFGDLAVREAVHAKVLSDHHGDPDTRVVDELGIENGAVRVDIAVINGFIHGFEIKSDADTLERLPRQIEVYGRVLDRATLVVGERHLAKAEALLPEWWGVKVATRGLRGAIHLSEVRRPSLNRNIEPASLAALLWSNEALQLLEEIDAARGVRGKRRELIYQRLAETLPLDALRDSVRSILKERSGWREHLISV